MFAALHRMSTVEVLWLKHFAPVGFALDRYHILVSLCSVSVESFRLNDPISQISCSPSVDLI